MKEKKKYEATFKLDVVKEYLQGDPMGGLARKWGLSKSLVRRWVDHYEASGSSGLTKKTPQSHAVEFKLKVVESYRNEGLSLRECCLRYNIANEGIVFSWARKYELSGLEGLRRRPGRPKIMKSERPEKKVKPLTRLEELEQENLYLRAENELLKKLEALTQKETPKKKR
jgi:transposase